LPGQFDQFSEDDLRAAAMKLEKIARKVNDAFLRVGSLDQDRLLPAMAEVYAEILRFDLHTREKFSQALEDKRVKTLAQGSVVMTCVMGAAVALTEFKRMPKPVSGSFLQRGLERLKGASSHPASLAGLSVAGFYGLMGRGLFLRARKAVKGKAH
jgi:hypothetical protein